MTIPGELLKLSSFEQVLKITFYSEGSSGWDVFKRFVMFWKETTFDLFVSNNMLYRTEYNNFKKGLKKLHHNDDIFNLLALFAFIYEIKSKEKQM